MDRIKSLMTSKTSLCYERFLVYINVGSQRLCHQSRIKICFPVVLMTKKEICEQFTALYHLRNTYITISCTTGSTISASKIVFY